MDEPDGLLSPRGSLWRSDVFALMHADADSTDVREGPQYQAGVLPFTKLSDAPIDADLEGEHFEPPPGSLAAHPTPSFSASDAAAFHVAMKLFDRDFRAVAKLVQRPEPDCIVYYYTIYKHSVPGKRYRIMYRAGQTGDVVLRGRRLVSAFLPTLAAAGRMDGPAQVMLKAAADDFSRGAIDLRVFVYTMVALAGRDAFVRSVEAAAAAGADNPDDPGFLLTPRSVHSLASSSLPLKTVFWDSVWPQLEGAGWTHDAATDFFYPPPGTDGLGAPAPPLDGMRSVLTALEADPSMLPPEDTVPTKPSYRRAPTAPSSLTRRRASPSPARSATLGVPTPPPRASPALGSASPASAKVCENCATTQTPLWRKDRQANMLLCNACGIYWKNHGRHRPVELAAAPPRASASSGISRGANAVVQQTSSSSPPSALGTPPRPPAHERVPRPPSSRRRSASAVALNSSDETSSLARPSSPSAMSSGATAELEASSDAAAAAERARVSLIERLVGDRLVLEDIQGAAESLASLKMARVSDAQTGREWGVVRLFADGADGSKQSDEAVKTLARRPRSALGVPLAAVAARSDWSGGGGGRAMSTGANNRGPVTSAGNRNPGSSAQACENCGTMQTPLWRKDRETGMVLCNACGIFLKTHGVQRPIGTSRFKQYAGPGNGAARAARSGSRQGRRRSTSRSRPPRAESSGGGSRIETSWAPPSALSTGTAKAMDVDADAVTSPRFADVGGAPRPHPLSTLGVQASQPSLSGWRLPLPAPSPPRPHSAAAGFRFTGAPEPQTGQHSPGPPEGMASHEELLRALGHQGPLRIVTHVPVALQVPAPRLGAPGAFSAPITTSWPPSSAAPFLLSTEEAPPRGGVR